MSSTLRDRLRSETAASHQRIDAAFSTLDLRDRADLSAFCRANLGAVQAIRCDRGAHDGAAERVQEEMTEALAADLAVLGAPHPDPQATTPVQPAAALYILLGSRAGTAVLRTRWRTAVDRKVRAAGHYFALDAERGAWRAFCAELAAAPAEGHAADSLIHDATRVFDLYHASFRANAPATGALHA